jgi:hypothetical protein
MTEEEWNTSVCPDAMLNHIWHVASARKMRLIGCAACRRIWDRMTDPRCREAVRASEQFADGLISEWNLDLLSGAAEEAFEDAYSVNDDLKANVANAASYSSSPSLAWEVLGEALAAIRSAGANGTAAECAAQSDLLRDLFGNPFERVALDRSWLTSDVVALARGIYDERAFDRMPILADALQDGGCTDDNILNHCRDVNRIHARGCSVVDLALGKE